MNPEDRLGESIKQIQIAREDIDDENTHDFLDLAEAALGDALDRLDEEEHRLAAAEPAQQPEEAG
jgi:DNA-binding protein YbaB